MASAQANTGSVDEGKLDEHTRKIYSITRNLTTDDFATLLGEAMSFFFPFSPANIVSFTTGFMDAQQETLQFANLNEIEKLIACCHLVSSI